MMTRSDKLMGFLLVVVLAVVMWVSLKTAEDTLLIAYSLPLMFAAAFFKGQGQR